MYSERGVITDALIILYSQSYLHGALQGIQYLHSIGGRNSIPRIIENFHLGCSKDFKFHASSSNRPDLGLLSATSHAATCTPARRAGDTAAADATEWQEHPEANQADEGGQEGRGGAVQGRRGILALPLCVGP